jgi:hypothetical protein
VNGSDPLWTNAIYLMMFLMLLTIAMIIFPLKETFVKDEVAFAGQSKAGKKSDL